MKGANLPINMLIILIIAVIVLIASIALFTGVWGQSSSGLSLDAAKNSGCHKYVSTNGCIDSDDGSLITINKVTCIDSSGNKVPAKTLDVLADRCFNTVPYDLCNC